MVAGATDKTAVADSLPDTFIAEVRLKTQEGPVMRQTVNNVTLPMGEGGQWEMTELTRATTIALSDGIDLATAEQITDTTLQITPTEFGAQVFVTDLARDQITKRTDLVRQVGRILGNSMVTKEDVDLLTQIDSFNTTTGGAGVSLTLGHIMAQITSVKSGGQAAGAIVAGTQEPGPGPWYSVWSSNQLHSVLKQMAFGTTLGYTAATDNDFTRAPSNTYDGAVASIAGSQTPISDNRAFREAVVGRVASATVLVDDNLGKDASDDAKGGSYSKEAMVQVHFRGGPKMEPDRDPSKRGTEYNIIMVKGVGEWKDQWGVEGLFDAASPTT